MKAYYDEFRDKVKLTVWGTRWEKDENGKVLGLGGARIKVFLTEIDLSKYDIWNILIDVENID